MFNPELSLKNFSHDNHEKTKLIFFAHLCDKLCVLCGLNKCLTAEDAKDAQRIICVFR